MRPSEALKLHRNEIREIIGQSKLENPRVFGSVLHGTDTEESDLDILVDRGPQGGSLFYFAHMEQELEAVLGVKVDLRTPMDLCLRIRKTIVMEAQPL